MTLVEPKPSPRPWFAVWRIERGTFGQLPLIARALFVEILKLTDDEGVIDLGGREPADAVAWALGADRSDRRALAKYVPMLLADGCLVHDGDRLIAPSFARWQPKPRAPKSSRAGTEPATTEPRSGRDGVAMVPRQRDEPEPKSAESLQVGPKSKVEESKVEEREDMGGADAPGPADQIRELSSRYPAELLNEARQGCALSRKNGRMTDAVWAGVLAKLSKLPDAAVLRALQTFVERYADGEKSEAYLLGIARGEAKRGGKSVSARLPPGTGKGWRTDDPFADIDADTQTRMVACE